jgi:hypothetical protein
MALPEADDEFVALGGPWVPDREQAVLTSVQKGGFPDSRSMGSREASNYVFVVPCTYGATTQRLCQGPGSQ